MAKKSSRTTQTPSKSEILSPEQFLAKALGHNQAQNVLKGIREQHNTNLKPKRFTIRLPFGAAAKAAQAHINDVEKIARQYGWTPPKKQS